MTALALAIAAAPAREAFAQPVDAPGAPAKEGAAPDKPASSTDTTKARALFDAGARAYDSGQFEAAIQAFEQAYAITPRDGLLFSLAQAHRKQYAVAREPANLAAAVDHYRRYLAKVKEGARRKDAAEALESLEPLLAASGAGAAPAAQPQKRATIVQISSSTKGALVSIDGGAPTAAPLTREVAPGVHKVRLSAPGFFEEEQTVEALSGEFLPFTYPLREKPAKLDVRGHDGADVMVDGRFVGSLPFSAPVEIPAGRHFVTVGANGHQSEGKELSIGRGESRALDVDLDATGQRSVAWVVLLSGASIVVGGGVLGVVALSRESDAQDVLERASGQRIALTEVSDYESARSDRDAFAVASVATLAGGAVVTLLGLGLFVFDAPDPVAAPSMSPAGSPSSAPPDEPEAPKPTQGPALELGILPSFGPQGGGAHVFGRF